jgi:peroxiredoxin
VSSVLTSVAASICCIVPVVAIVFGLGAFGLATWIEVLRPYLLGLTALLLATALYLTYEPCVAEIPSLNQLQAKYGAQGVKVIGLAVQSGWPKDIKRFVSKHKMQYTILVGTDDTVADFDVISFPTTFLIAPGWRVYKKYTGAYKGKDAAIERDIEALLIRKQ